MVGMQSHAIARLGIAYVPQGRHIFPTLTTEENLRVAARKGVDGSDKWNLESVYKFFPRLEERKDSKGDKLSGGEKQRVAICRALINDPDLILADEPTGNLDSKSGQIVIDALVRINQEFGKTIVMVTHDPQMASYCSRIILLKDGVILDNLNHGDSHEGFYQEIIGRMAEL